MEILFSSTKKGLVSLAIVTTFSVGNAQAAKIVLDFEGVGDLASVHNFYNGGTDGAGNSGIDYGIHFSSAANGLVDLDAGGSGNFANEPSPDSVLIFRIGGDAIMNVAAGFDTNFSFSYNSATAAFVNVFNGLDGTGTLLASLDIATNFNNSCNGDPFGDFCHWDSVGATFSGNAKSVVFGGPAEFTLYDNVTLGSATSGEVPIPGAFWLMGSGLLGLLKMKRKGANPTAGA